MRFNVHAMFAAIDAAEFETLGDYFHSDIVYRRPGYPALTSIDRVLNFYRHERIIDRGRHEVQYEARSGPTQFVAGVFTGTGRDGSPIPPTRFADCYLLLDETIIERTTYFFTATI